MNGLETILTVNDMENITGIRRDFVRMAMDSFKLSKFVVNRRPMAINCNKEFIELFKDYLNTKGCYKKAESLDKIII